MADPHGRGDGGRADMVSDGFCSSGVAGGREFSDGEAVGVQVVKSVEESPVVVEKSATAADPDGSPATSAVEETLPLVEAVRGQFDQGRHASFDFEESRALQIEEEKMSSSFELSRAISTVVGPDIIDRHFGIWGQIELVLASIPGARIAITSTVSPKLKIRDFRKIHIQESLNLNHSSLPKLTKFPKPKFTPKAAQQFLPPPKPYKSSNLPHNPKKSRSSRPTKTINLSNPSPINPTPKKSSHPKNTFSFPLPTPEWMAMMDRVGIPEPGREGTSLSAKGSGKEASVPTVRDTRTMAEVIKGVQPRSLNQPLILDASKLKQRGTATEEDGVPCLHIPDSDNSELAGRIGLALIGKFSHSIPAPPT